MTARRARRAVAAALVALAVAAPPAAGQRTAPAGGGPTVPDDLAARYLVHRPDLGPVTVVDVSAEPDDRRLLAATLQGIVNRSQARIYLVGARAAAEDQLWLDRYEARDLIDVDARIGLDAALAAFADEVAGYVVADAAEPWTINTATTAAGALGAVVVTPTTRAAADDAGLTQLEDHRGRWGDAATAYEETAAALRDRLGGHVALQQPDRHAPRDLFVQQGAFVAYTRPSQADYDRVSDLVETFPSHRPLYGYVSDTGDEEVAAVARLSVDDRYLVPTDTTSNLSFHQAVGGDQRARPTPTDPDEVAPCDPEQVNVVLSFSDGDNLVVPAVRYPTAANWLHPRRGELPMGWGVTPALAVLAPAMWDEYVATATTADELVDMMGLGYSYPTLMPGAASHLADGMRLRAALGMDVTWSLDALLSDPGAAGWDAVEAAARTSGAPPRGWLLNYGRWPGAAWFHSPLGLPVITSQQTSYEATPDDIAAQVAALVDDPDRPLVTFIAATVWNTSYGALVDALVPLRDQGVRFLTPSEAVACLPDPPPEPTTTTTTSPTATTAPAPAAPPAAAPVSAQPTYTG